MMKLAIDAMVATISRGNQKGVELARDQHQILNFYYLVRLTKSHHF